MARGEAVTGAREQAQRRASMPSFGADCRSPAWLWCSNRVRGMRGEERSGYTGVRKGVGWPVEWHLLRQNACVSTSRP